MRVAIISSCYGAYDPPKAPTRQECDHDVDYIMVTDEPDEWAALGWTTIHEPRPHVHPNVAAKVAKCCPELYVDGGTNITVWVDAGSEIGPGLVTHIVTRFLSLGDDDATSNATALMFPHPHRRFLEDEVVVSRQLPKYAELPMEAQVRHYLDGGYPDENLWATGCIARFAFNPVNESQGYEWLREIVRWGFQDQLSFGYTAWMHGMQVAPLGESLFTSPHIRFADHTHKT